MSEGTRILVVDDEQHITDFIALGLRHEGYQVRTAPDGRAALRLVDEFKPQLVVLDLMMPRMDGYGFVAELERRNLRDEIPIIVLTADGKASTKADHLGAAAGVAKPFDVTMLLGEVARLMRRPGDND